MKQAIGVLLLLAAAAAGVWWMLSGPGDAGSAAVESTSTRGSGSGPSGGALDESPARRAVDATSTPKDGGAPQPVTAAPFKDAVVPTGVIEVRIVGPDGAPVPNAEAHCVAWPKRTPEEAASRQARRAAGARGRAVATSDEAPPLTTVVWSDSEGRIRPPTSGGKVRVTAKAGRLRGQKTFEPAADDDEPNVLKLKSGLAVEVVDPEGRPAVDVLVQIALEGVGEVFPGDGARCRTGRDGVASFDGRAVRNAVKMASTVMQGRTEAAPRTLLVALVAGLPVDASPSAPIPEKDDGPPVRLTLPPTGDVEIRILSADGAPYGKPVDAAIFAEGDQTWKSMEFGGGDPSRVERSTAVARANQGVVRIARVATAAKLRAVAWFADASLRPVEVVFEGPAAGATATVVLKTAGPRLRYRGRLLDADGGPVTGLFGFVQFEDTEALRKAYGNGYTAGFTALLVDPAAGTFEATTELDPALFPGGKLLFSGNHAVKSKDKPATASASMVSFTASAIAGLPDADGVVQLGDIRFDRVDLYAEGVVVDEAGKPIARAQVSVRRRETTEEAEDWSPGFVSDYESGIADVWTDAKGRFSLVRSDVAAERRRGVQRESEDASEAAVAERRLFAEVDGRYCLDGAVFAPGARDVRIQMLKGGGIAGSFLAGTDPSLLEGVSVHLSGAAALPLFEYGFEKRRGETEVYARGGTFSEKGLMPGSLQVRFRHETLPEPFLVVDLEIRAGEIVRDPRLKDIDLGKLLSIRKITVVDEVGRPIGKARIHVESGEHGWSRISVDAKGVGVVPALGSDLHVAVTADGYRGVEIPKLASDQRVVLVATPPTAVRLRLKPGTPPPKSEFRCEILLQSVEKVRPSDGSDADDARHWEELGRLERHPLRPEAEFTEQDVIAGAVGTVSSAGRYRATILVKRIAGDQYVAFVDAGEIDIPPESKEFSAILTPDAEQWARGALGIEPPPSEAPADGDGGDDGGG